MVKLKNKAVKKGIIVALLIIIVATLTGITVPAAVSITESGHLSVGSNIALAANKGTMGEGELTSTTRYTGITTVTEEPWGYRYVLENGDIVEVGDSTTTDFKAHVKTIRWNGVADFSLWLEGGTFVPTLTDNTVSFDFNSSISVSIYPVTPCERLPEGGIEYDITLSKAPAKPTVTLNADWNNVTWEKIYGLDVEYDQARAYDSWYDDLYDNYPANDLYGHDNGTGIFIITPTDVMTPDGQVSCIHREEYEVNSYIGACTSPTVVKSDMGNGVTYSNVSRSHLRIHRGEMTDALNDTAWIEDITLNEVAKTFTFALPKTWLRNATYPVSQVCGVDPAYTEDMDNWITDYGSDDTWEDYDIFTNHDVPKGAVAEIIMANQETGYEAQLGIRTDGSGLNRYIWLHEAEGGGETHCRMFVLVDDSTGLVETWADDVSDVNLFYVVGYWENMTFTELATEYAADDTATWVDETLAVGASVTHHIIMANGEDDAVNTMGVRANGSELERLIVVHRQTTGGNTIMDLIVNADADKVIDLYTTDTVNTFFVDSGYFTEMVFTELWQSINAVDAGWQSYDISAYLDGGALCDFLLTHGDIATAGITMGARSGLDTTTNRYLVEHEAEDTEDNTEFTGFGISALALDETVYLYVSDAAVDNFHLAGYINVLPEAPTNLASPSQTETTIDLTWTKGENTDKTLIRFRDDQYPTGIEDGELAYFDTGESVTVEGSDKSIIQDATNASQPLYAGFYIRAGERVNAFPAANISRASFKLAKYGSPTGTAYVRIRKVSDDSILATIAEINVATGLTTTPTWYDFDCDVDNPAEQDLRFTVEYDGGSSSTYVDVALQTTDVLADAVYTRYTSSWIDSSSFDLTIKIYYFISLEPATTYYFRAWGYQSATELYSEETADLTQATSGALADISNEPDSENLGVVSANTTYYAYGSAPSNPVEDGECTFTVTNNSGANVDITIEADNFTGGVGWALTSGAPGENTVKMIAYYSGQDPASGVTLTTGPQAFISALADNTSELWDFSLTTGNFTDGAEKTSTITLSAALS